MNTARKGASTALAVAAALARRGETILMPYSDAERYDLALDRNGTLYRIQCKTGRLRAGAVIFNTCSGTRRSDRRDYTGQIEAFGVFCEDLGVSFLVPVENVKAKTACWLRVDPAKHHGRRKHVHDANQYLI